MKKQPKMYQDHNGNDIPSTYLHKIDKDKDAAAKRLFKKATDLNGRLESFKAELLETCDELYNRVLSENKVTIRENSKGGYSIMTVDKSIKIEISIRETMSFDDRIDVAQAKIKEFLAEKTKGIDLDISTLINNAFETRKGQLDTKRVMGLMKLNITHHTWVEAMELIRQSIQTNNTKRYVRVWERQIGGEYKAVKLDFASI